MSRCAPHFSARVALSLGALVTLTLIAVGLATVAVTGCGSPTSTTSASSPAASAPASPGVPVTFATEDGVTLGGHLFGSGKAGIVLSHMYPSDQTSWFSAAQRLASAGYLVLTFDFRGYGESGGEKQIAKIDLDVTAAISEIQERGAASVVLAGASMGGTASLVAGERAQVLSSIRLVGIATLSAPVEFRGLSAAASVPRIVVPLLFIAAENDVGASGARQLEELSGGKGELRIVPGGDHGTDLLTGTQAENVYQLLMDFIEASLAS